MFNIRRNQVINEGNHIVKIISSEVERFSTNCALKLQVMTQAGARRSFLLFDNNPMLIEKLIEATSIEMIDGGFDEKSLVGKYVSIDTQMYKGYLNIYNFTACEAWEFSEQRIYEPEDLEEIEI